MKSAYNRKTTVYAEWEKPRVWGQCQNPRVGGALELPQPQPWPPRVLTPYSLTIVTADGPSVTASHLWSVSAPLRRGCVENARVWVLGPVPGKHWLRQLGSDSSPSMPLPPTKAGQNLEPGVLGKKNKKPSPALDSTVNLLFTIFALIYKWH